MSNSIKVLAAEYVGELSLRITFNDGRVVLVDFNSFFIKYPHPQYSKYSKPEEFKRFSIESGNVVWGKDWDLIFPIEDLYSAKIF